MMVMMTTGQIFTTNMDSIVFQFSKISPEISIRCLDEAQIDYSYVRFILVHFYMAEHLAHPALVIYIKSTI